MECHCDLYPGHDCESERRELRRQLLDAESESGDQQRRGWQRPTLDCDWPMFDLFDRTGYSDWTGGIRYNQLEHKLELECGYSTRRM